MKVRFEFLEKIAQQKYQRDAFELQCCIREMSQIKENIDHLRQIGSQSVHLNHNQVAFSWLSWRNERIGDLNLRLFSLSASLEQYKLKTQKSYGRHIVCKKLIKGKGR